MKKVICLIGFTLFSISILFSQELNVINLKLDSLEKVRTRLATELKAVEKSIQELENEKLLIEVEALKEEGIRATTKTEGKIRSAPSAVSDIVTKIPAGTEVLVLSYKQGYYEVIYNEGVVGYLNSMYFVENEEMKLLKSEIKLDDQPQSYQSSPSYAPPKSYTRPSTTRRYIRGPRGGCYYINSNGKKTYVDRSNCN